MQYKRLTAFLLCMAMLLSMVPVFAQETVLPVETITEMNSLYQGLDITIPEPTPVMPMAETTDYLTDTAEIAALIRAAMVARQESFQVYYQTNTYSGEAIKAKMSELFHAALEHTGNPVEGDYLRWQYGGFSAKASTIIRGGVYYATITYTVPYYTTVEEEALVDAEVDSLLTELAPDNATDYRKLENIYDYICGNVVYDHANLNDNTYTKKYTAYAALFDGTAVCQGYALLVYRLALEAGIDCRVISGTSSGGAHGWNIAKLGDLYYNLDATWDAGVSNYNYFLRCPNNFGGHTRYDEWTTAEFQAAYPMSDTDAVDCAELESGHAAHRYSCTTTEPTCNEDGAAVYTCAICKDSYTDVIPTTGHDYESVVTDPTCEDAGYTTYSCTVCGESYTDHETDATGHSYESVVTDPTCEDAGYTTYSCTVCGESYTDRETDATGHSYESVVTKPTCTEGGYTTYTCTVCGDNYTDCETDATGHDYEAIITKPTCTQKGYTTHTCTVCGTANKDTFVDALGHQYERSICIICKEPDPSVLAYGECGENQTWLLTKDGVLTISGTGVIAEYPWHPYRNSIKELVIEQGITGIDAYAFAECGNLKTVVFRGNAPKLDDACFGNVTATCYYPLNNTTWTSKVMQHYGGELAWVSYADQLKVTVGNDIASGKIKLTWDNVLGAAKYKVYRCKTQNGNYGLINTVTGTSTINKNAVAGQKYYYYVVAVAADGTVSETSNLVSRTCDLARPVITLSNDAATGKVKISWDAVEGATKYKVYRCKTENGTYGLLNTVTATSMINKNGVAGTRYYYKVVAVAENTDANSAASVIKNRVCDLARPVVSITHHSDGKPKLTWSAIDGAVSYKVYRCKTKTGTYGLMKTVTDTSYVNLNAVAGTTYYYKVVAVHSNTNANSAYSTIVSIKSK